MTNWKEYKLGDLVAINERSIGKGFVFKSIEYIDTSSVTENKFDAPNYTTIAEAPSRAKRLIADGDTIISTVRPIQKHYGFIKNSKPNQVVSTGFAVVTPKKIEPRYLYYFLTQSEITEFLNTVAEGGTTTFPAFKADELKDLPINLPDIDTQTAIAEILSSLDDKIELNNKINQELENLAQTLFKQWFIDFEFPISLNHDSLDLHDEQDLKINTKENNQVNQENPKNHGSDTYRSSGGEMVESELGEIPKGWGVGVLGDILEAKGGTTPSTKEPSFWDGEIHWTSPRDLSNLQFPLLLNTEKKITKEGLKKISSGLLPKGTLLLSSRAPIGYLAITEIETAINQGYIAINCNQGFSNLYLLYWLKQNMDSVIERANGSTFLEISKSNFKQIKCIIPDKIILSIYVKQVELLFEQLRINLIENQELTNLRDTLLPKLISGELEVKSLNRDFLDLLDEKDFKKNAKINQGSDNNQGNQDNPKNQG